MAHSLELEQAVLEVLYKKCLDRPLWVSESEVFWNISDVRVTEREVREVLEQLVYHRRIVKQVGKYQISKAEFLAIKEQMEGLGELQGDEQPPTECKSIPYRELSGKERISHTCTENKCFSHTLTPTWVHPWSILS